MLTVRPTGVQLTAQNNLFHNQQRQDSTTERLATGLRINSAKDDPAGLVAAENLRGDLVDIGARRRTIGGERSQVRVEQSGRQQAVDVLQEVRGLAIEAASDSTSPDAKTAIQSQIDSSLDALGRIEAATGISVSSDVYALATGGDASVLEDPAAAQALIDETISGLVSDSAVAGAYEKYTLDVDERLAQDREVVIATALSEIADADYAEETANLTRDTILSKVAIQTFGLLDRTRGDAILSLLG